MLGRNCSLRWRETGTSSLRNFSSRCCTCRGVRWHGPDLVWEHSFLPLEAPVSSAFGVVLGTAGHAIGWPMPRGGSQSISNALADYFRELGGRIEINRGVQNLNDLPKSRVTLFDTTAWEFPRIAGDRLPPRYRNRLENFRHTPGVFKIDYAPNGPIPWKAKPANEPGRSISVAFSMKSLRQSATSLMAKFPERPFVLVAQQSLFDNTRAPRGAHALDVLPRSIRLQD